MPSIAQSTILLEILRRANRITPAEMEDAMQNKEDGGDPITFLLKNDVIVPGDVSFAYSHYVNAPSVDLDKVDIEADFSSLFGIDLLTRYSFLPLYRFASGLWIIGAVDPGISP